MTPAVGAVYWQFRREARSDRALRAESKRRQAAILKEAAKAPDAGPELRRQAAFYLRRLEAGRERTDDRR